MYLLNYNSSGYSKFSSIMKNFVNMFNFRENGIIHTKNNCGRTCLHTAAVYGKFEVLKYLVNCGASLQDTDNKGNTALSLAVYYGHLDIIKYLVTKGSSLHGMFQGHTHLQWSAIRGHLEIMKYLLSNGAHVEEKDEDDISIIQLACMYGHIDIVVFLHQNGCSITEKNIVSQGTCLLYASINGHLGVIKYLLANGSCIDEKSADDSAITFASKGGYLETIQWLVNEKGCSLQEMNNEGTCVMNAAKKRHIDCVIWMLHNGSSLDENNSVGYSGKIYQVKSCRDILKNNGLYETAKKALTTKSSRK